MTANAPYLVLRMACLLGVIGLMACAGCGSRYIAIELDRPTDLDRPAWIGVYFLDQETALDGHDNVQLADPDAVGIGAGVVAKEVYSLQPGTAKTIRMEEYDQQIQWIVVAAGFPGDPECARKKIPVEEGSKLSLSITVHRDCITVDAD